MTMIEQVESFLEQRHPGQAGALGLAAHAEQGEQLVDDVVRGDEGLGVSLEPGFGGQVAAAGGHEQSEPCPGVHEDLAFPP
jgi:hypothetical protein